jgi:hypothetical protein
MPDPHQVRAGILASPHQIPGCLDVSLGDGNRRDLVAVYGPEKVKLR